MPRGGSVAPAGAARWRSPPPRWRPAPRARRTSSFTRRRQPHSLAHGRFDVLVAETRGTRLLAHVLRDLDLRRGVEPEVLRPPVHDPKGCEDRLVVAALYCRPEGEDHVIEPAEFEREHFRRRLGERALDRPLDGIEGAGGTLV